MTQLTLRMLMACLLVSGLSAGASAKYHEAPSLAKLVAAGELPPVEERLPEEPLVVEPIERIGEYGGTWRRAALGPTDVQLHARLTYESLVRWSPDGSTVVPNVAKSFEVSSDGRVFTFHLRKGMKWSDGHPFTAEDFEFWWNDIVLNKEIHPVVPEWLTIDGEPAKFTKVDDYTIRFEFSKPYGLFIRQVAYQGEWMTQWPKHYLSQFHIKYTDPEKLKAMVRQAGFEAWYQLLQNKQDLRINPDVPVITAWKLELPSPHVPVVANRNPYYWKVDPEGNQLPYIDTVTHQIVENPQVLNLKAAAGEIDMQLRHILIENLPVFAENQRRNGFRILQWYAAEPNNLVLYPNLFIEDEVLRELYRDKRFRIALSLAIDRDEINQLAYLGLGRPRQGGVIPQSPYHVEGSELNYTQRDLNRANQLLDELGLDRRDSEGYRLLPDGRRLSITIDMAPVFGPWPKVGELIVDYWKDVGIRATINVMERTLFEQRAEAGQFDWAVWLNDRGLTPEVDPLFLLPGRGQTALSPWFDWFSSNGADGTAPPAGTPERRAYEIYAEVKATADQERLTELMRELITLNMENLWYIGTVGDLPHIVIVKNNFRNVPETAVSDWLQKTPGNTWPEQYFIDQ